MGRLAPAQRAAVRLDRDPVAKADHLEPRPLRPRAERAPDRAGLAICFTAPTIPGRALPGTAGRKIAKAAGSAAILG